MLLVLSPRVDIHLRRAPCRVPAHAPHAPHGALVLRLHLRLEVPLRLLLRGRGPWWRAVLLLVLGRVLRAASWWGHLRGRGHVRRGRA